MRYQRHCLVTHFWSCFRPRGRCLLGKIQVKWKDLKHSLSFFFFLHRNYSFVGHNMFSIYELCMFVFLKDLVLFQSSVLLSLSLCLSLNSLSFSPSFNVNSPELSSEH